MKIWLASSSPRRAALLRDAGFDVAEVPPELDDSELSSHCSATLAPAHWALAMAWLKAACVRSRMLERPPAPMDGILLAADTVCDHDGSMIGKPTDRDDARRILEAFAGRAHQVHTGVCLLDLGSGQRLLFADSTTVTLGPRERLDLDAYLEGDDWAGKAGGYNYADRLAVGWPLDCDGDPTSVMGLPMTRLRRLLGDAATKGVWPTVVAEALGRRGKSGERTR